MPVSATKSTKRWDDLVTKDYLKDHLELRFEAFESRITAAFRAELNASITSQTRSIILGQMGAVIATAAAVIAAAQLA